MHIIKSVAEGSIAEEFGIEPGDKLIAIDDHEIEDVFDYRYYISSDSYVMLIEKPDGEQWECEIDDDYEDPGLEFDSGLMSDYRHCSNKCIFCFIDQMPPGMRETLYFKDDDARLSFLQGNYVTLTNMKEHDIERIIEYHMEPINVSVHTTDPQLRCRMLNNRRAGESLKIIDRLREAGIHMNGQIVMCPGWNDGAQLEKTFTDMLEWTPELESVSVVPIGMTKYRDRLTKIEPVDKKTACETIDIVERFQKLAMEKTGTHLFHASDEFYILAERDIPEEDIYDGYIQLENGVGMLRLLMEETTAAMEELEVGDREEAGDREESGDREETGDCEETGGREETGDREESEFRAERNPDDMSGAAQMEPADRRHQQPAGGSVTTRAITAETITLATGKLAAPVLEGIAKKLTARYPEKRIQVVPIVNHFFGEMITVSGLITGQDLREQLSKLDLGDRVLLPINMFRSGEETFLDDMTRSELEDALGVPVQIGGSSGYDLINALMGTDCTEEFERGVGRYELDD